jgi:hypothetical protein
MTRALAGLLALVLAGGAHALTPGGGPPDTDCLAEFGGSPPNYPTRNPRDIRCIDNDPSCDDNPDAGVCRFRVEVCVNVADPELPTCAGKDLEDYFVENEQPDTNPRHDFDFQNLQDRLNFLVLPVEATDHDSCSGDVGMNLPLPIRLVNGGAKYRRRVKTLRATISGPAQVEDTDKLRMTCVPAAGASPCDGVTSTFDQIQKHVFTATCALPTCHNAPQPPHFLSLEAGQAYDNLVGVPAENVAAANAGKLRVVAGDPAASFIVQKLRGHLAVGEGERMPRDLPRLEELKIRLIEEWIAAGAPATGFVTPVGCH